MSLEMTRISLACTLAALLTVTGCQALDNLTSVGSPEPVETAAVPPEPARQSTGGTVAESDPAAAPVNDDPMQFMGLQGMSVAAQLGKPDLVRRDSGVEVRQFRGKACILDLFLYPAGSDLAVKHVELRGPSLDADARRACLAEMIRERTLAG